MRRMLLAALSAVGTTVMLTLVLKAIHVATGGWPPEFVAGAIVGAVGWTVARVALDDR